MKAPMLTMKLPQIIIAVLATVVACAGQPLISSFARYGQLTWTNSPATNGFTVEWAPTVTGAWYRSWQTLDSIISTGAQTTVAVPMFYRVAQGFSRQSMRGVWMMTDRTSSKHDYFIAQEDGTISEVSFFNPITPAGYFQVDSSGGVSLTFLSTRGRAQTGSGRFVGPNQLTVNPPLTNVVVQRLEDCSRCAGSWTGTLTQTNGAGTPAAYPVSFTVDSSGWVMSFTGFPSLVTGRVFALSNGAAVARFYTGLDSGNYYNQFRITGTLSANSIQGTYDADSPSDNPVQGTAVLTRQ